MIETLEPAIGIERGHAARARRGDSLTIDVIADIARHITLVPGDVILMGTPCHSRSVDPGHFVECEITGIGRVGGDPFRS